MKTDSRRVFGYRCRDCGVIIINTPPLDRCVMTKCQSKNIARITRRTFIDTLLAKEKEFGL